MSAHCSRMGDNGEDNRSLQGLGNHINSLVDQLGHGMEGLRGCPTNPHSRRKPHSLRGKIPASPLMIPVPPLTTPALLLTLALMTPVPPRIMTRVLPRTIPVCPGVLVP
mmetsp:Transcript_1805/g.5057  ORF Transcript_1805/g.5057 Transcript_1805/m.5057 type:complete len:109 (-) Transcript_1805:228-554(-)